MGMAGISGMWPGSFEATFVLPSQEGATWSLKLNGPVVPEEMFENVDKDEIWVTVDQVQRMTFTSDTCISKCIHLVYNTYQLLHHKMQ